MRTAMVSKKRDTRSRLPGRGKPEEGGFKKKKKKPIGKEEKDGIAGWLGRVLVHKRKKS